MDTNLQRRPLTTADKNPNRLFPTYRRIHATNSKYQPWVLHPIIAITPRNFLGWWQWWGEGLRVGTL